jgi:inorganic triphosphatase YgiF
MVLEARFNINDPGIFWAFQTMDQLANYELTTQQARLIDDTYLDTKNRELLAAGYICRRREQGKSVLITLTKIESSKTSAQQPNIWEISLEHIRENPVNWPESQVRSRVIKTVHNKQLRTIFSLNQIRITRIIQKENQVIGQANLDDVSLIIKSKEQHLKTLKLKIVASNTDIHLNTLIAALHKKWGLEPDTRTKYEHVTSMEQQYS